MSENPPANPNQSPTPAPAAPASDAPATAAPATGTPPPNAAPAAKDNGKSRRLMNSPLFLVVATLVLTGLLFVGLGYFFYAMTHESTDDAFIAGHVVSIAPRIAGQVVAVHVLDNELVHSNELLIEIDPSDYATTQAQKQAAQASEESSYKAAVAGYELMGVKVKTAEADAQSSQADAVSAEATATQAKADFERAQTLIKDQTISAQEFDQAKATVDRAEADLNSARQKAASDESKVNEAVAQKDAVWAEAGSVLAKFNQSKTDVDAANLNLSYTKIFAPGDGLVTRKQVEVGDYLQTGQQIMSLVPTDVWVLANFKESQLEKMKKNQPVIVEIDALGGRKFRAHLDSVQAGSGAQFSLLPPENATGNFVKVVQRVPVKIVFDEALPADHTIGPGLSVTPSVQVSSFTVPAVVTALAALAMAVVIMIVFWLILNRKNGAK
jgi:membrane fusion protein, multidrug efflux system